MVESFELNVIAFSGIIGRASEMRAYRLEFKALD